MTRIKKSRKGKQKWKDSCSIARLLVKMFKILMKTKFVSNFILFQDSCFKKLFDIEMKFSYIMDGNKFYNCPLKFLWVKHGLLLKP